MRSKFSNPYLSFSPLFKEFTGFEKPKAPYKCGPCDGDTKDKSCKECTGKADAACQAYIETDDFKCKNWEYNETDKKFKLKTDATTCNKLKATKIACNM